MGTRVQAEDAELIKYFDWVGWQEKVDPRFCAIFHVANERRTSLRAGALLKRKGVRAGVCDIIVPIPFYHRLEGIKYHGLWIELKVKPNKLSPAQKDFMALLHNLDHCVRVAWSGDEAIEMTRKYLKGETP